jgi:predicted O-methyltransferase YrrM
VRRTVDSEASEVTVVDGIAPGPSVRHVAEALRARMCPSERSFDRFLPRELRRVSRQHWTPLVVALRVAEWLEDVAAENVVDIGSGAGKFCVATALASRCDFTGIEQRPRLVEAARALARIFGVDDRVRFIHGNLRECSIPDADAYYLYNPFLENLLEPGEHLDDDVEFSDARYMRDIAFVEELLARARVGTYVIKYNGFGGRMPSTYDEFRVDREMPNVLRMWQKTRSTRAYTTSRLDPTKLAVPR